MFDPDGEQREEARTIQINPDAAMSRLRASKDRYIIFIDDGGIPIVGGSVGTVDDERAFLERMLERWYEV